MKKTLTTKETHLILDIIAYTKAYPLITDEEDPNKGYAWYWEFSSQQTIEGKDLQLASDWKNVYSIPGIIGSLTQKGLVTVYKDKKFKTLNDQSKDEPNESTLNWDFTNLRDYSEELANEFEKALNEAKSRNYGPLA
tara:strand:+ start:281 stop:691 length:411 start_codon:yes stop_codon:yes gene_type:complete